MRGLVNYFDAPNTRYVRFSVTNLGNDKSWTLGPAQVAELSVFDETTGAFSSVGNDRNERRFLAGVPQETR